MKPRGNAAGFKEKHGKKRKLQVLAVQDRMGGKGDDRPLKERGDKIQKNKEQFISALAVI